VHPLLEVEVYHARSQDKLLRQSTQKNMRIRQHNSHCSKLVMIQ